MTDLWGDVWFYISTLGFLGSGVLFLYLLGQYRSAVEEADEGDTAYPSLELPSREALPAKPRVVELTPAPVAAPIVPLPRTKAAPAVALPVADAPSEKKERQPSQAGVAPATPLPAAAPEPRRSDGVGPAVAYLQSIKSQLERFDESIKDIKALSAQQAAQGQLVLQRLSELAEGFKTDASARLSLPAATRSSEPALETPPEPAPAHKPGGLRPAAAEPEPSAVLPASAREAEAEADPAAATVAIEALPQEPATPEPASPAPEPEPAVRPFQPRKGPVWPV